MPRIGSAHVMLRGPQAPQPQLSACLVHRRCGLFCWAVVTAIACMAAPLAGAAVGRPSNQVACAGLARLTPFLLHLLNQGLAKATVSRHRDNLWTLGGELIRRRYDDDELARQDVKAAFGQIIGRDGGPLMWPRITEAQQNSLDATCRKLERFWRAAAAADASS